tara:strand:- start:234 stop:560 length:327 start_codon:yes stop_codon:yes gene_type:complete
MIHTSESLKAQDGDYENYHYQLEDGEQYLLTEGELGWLDFVEGRYSIADHLEDNMVDGVYTMDSYGLGEALQETGMFPKAVCLSDDTVLQAIFFYSAVDVSDLDDEVA